MAVPCPEDVPLVPSEQGCRVHVTLELKRPATSFTRMGCRRRNGAAMSQEHLLLVGGCRVGNVCLSSQSQLMFCLALTDLRLLIIASPFSRTGKTRLGFRVKA